MHNGVDGFPWQDKRPVLLQDTTKSKNNAHHLDGEDDETVNEKLPSLIESLALRANLLIPLRILIIVTHPHKDNDDIKNTLHSNMTTNHNDNSNTNKQLYCSYHTDVIPFLVWDGTQC